MSDPKRYDCGARYVINADSKIVGPFWFESVDGEFVLWKDYARLKAEVERYKFTLEEERQIARQDWAGLRCEHDRVKRALEHAEAEVERLRSLFANSEWQPIETAPLDGTDILCFCVEPEFAGEENPWTEFRVCFYGMLNEGESCWMSHYGYEQRPTHWMPLPKSPIS